MNEKHQPTPKDIKEARVMLSKKQQRETAIRESQYKYGGGEKSGKADKDETPKKSDAVDVSGSITEQLTTQLTKRGIKPGEIIAATAEAERAKREQAGIMIKRLEEILEIQKKEGSFPALQRMEKQLLEAYNELEKSRAMTGKSKTISDRIAHYEERVRFLDAERVKAQEQKDKWLAEKEAGKNNKSSQPEKNINKGQETSQEKMSKNPEKNQEKYAQNEADRIKREGEGRARFEEFAGKHPEYAEEIKTLRERDSTGIRAEKGSEESLIREIERIRKEGLISKEKELSEKYLKEEREKREKLDPISRTNLFIKEYPQHAELIKKMQESAAKEGQVFYVVNEEAMLERFKDIERVKKAKELSEGLAAEKTEKGTGRVESAGGTPVEVGKAKTAGGEFVEGVKTAGEEAEEKVEEVSEKAVNLEGPPPPTPPDREAEKEKRAETPPLDCYDFGSCCEKVSDGVKRFAKKLYEGVRMNTVDRAKVWFSQKLYDWHDKKSRKFAGEVSANDKQIVALEAQIKKQEERLSGRFVGASASSRERIHASIQKMRMRVEKLAADKEKVQSRLANRENHKRRYENKRKDIAAETLGRIAEGLRPYELKISSLKNCKNQLDLEVKSHTDRKKEFQNELEALRREMANAPKEEKKAIKEEMAIIKAELKQTEKYLKGLVKERQKTEKRLTKWDKGSSYWRDAHNVFSRIANRETVYFEKETKKSRVEAKLGRQEISADGGKAAPAERKEAAAEIQPLGERLQKWNDLFASKFQVRLSDLEMAGIVSGEVNLSDWGVSVNNFERILNDYYVFQTGRVDRRKLPSNDEFEKMVAIMKRWE
ncbi:MAG: hypothetical protein HZA37_02125 [Parcubacteria group bacterium]|nr:hypothetical protein [Parcubacteria group bacterium]